MVNQLNRFILNKPVFTELEGAHGMQQHVAVVTMHEKAAQTLKNQLNHLLGNYITITEHSVEKGIGSKIACDICLTPAEDLEQEVIRHIRSKTRILPVRRTISKHALQRILDLPSGTKVLLVNTSLHFVEETLRMILREGANELAYFLYYPGCSIDYSDIHIAITPNELGLVPEGIEEIINIGDRLIDLYTLLELTTTLGIFNAEVQDVLMKYSTRLIQSGIPASPQLFGDDFYDVMIKLLAEENGSSFLVHTIGGTIIYQSRCERFFGEKCTLGQSIRAVLPDPRFAQMKEIPGEMTLIAGQKLWTNKRIYSSRSSQPLGAIFFRDVDYHKKWLDMASARNESHHRQAKYHFDDIQGACQQIKHTIQLAQKIAGSDLDVLIEGESGTGKELFANAIHNASSRRNGPFVAFNCAAITQSLFESELFGYEDGAFTGARRGGRGGLIEAANGGTLFLDEIGELNLSMQAKLLRILQERELIRVGSNKRVPLDIRVISATNQDLRRLVEKGAFRLDLYYRFSVAPLYLPPLREHPDDIPLLLQNMLKRAYIDVDIPEETLLFLKGLPWPGNHRQLQNFCEYMMHVEKSFSLKNVKQFFSSRPYGGTVPKVPRGHDFEIDDVNRRLLELLAECHGSGEKIGRKKLADLMQRSGYALSEQETRTLLKRLISRGFVVSRKGRGGTVITPRGLALLQNI